MKKLLLGFLLLFGYAASAQQHTDAFLINRNDSLIRNKPALPGRTADQFALVINSKASLLGSYADPAWITSLAWSKITGTPTAYTFTTSDFDVSGGNVVSIDYTNGQAASGSTKGFTTAADWTTFNNKAGTASPTFSGSLTILNGARQTVLSNSGIATTGATAATYTISNNEAIAISASTGNIGITASIGNVSITASANANLIGNNVNGIGTTGAGLSAPTVNLENGGVNSIVINSSGISITANDALDDITIAAADRIAINPVTSMISTSPTNTLKNSTSNILTVNGSGVSITANDTGDVASISANGDASLYSTAGNVILTSQANDINISSTVGSVNIVAGTEITLTSVEVIVDNLSGVGTRIVTAGVSGSLGSLTPAALTRVDDINVTLTLGGTPATSLLQATSLTLGWTGTLAAARLNANVVQAVTNDTNVTGSIATQTLTLGWTGTLAYSRFVSGTGLSVVGRSTNTSGVQADIAAGSDANILRRSGTSIGFGSIDLAANGAVGSSILAITNGGTGSSSQTAQLLTGTNTFTGAVTDVGTTTNTYTFQAAFDATLTAGFSLINTTQATVGAQKISVPFMQRGSGWKTTATAGPQNVDYYQYVSPVQGAANPSGFWVLASSVNGAAAATAFAVDTEGNATVPRAIAFGNVAPSTLVNGEVYVTGNTLRYVFSSASMLVMIANGGIGNTLIPVGTSSTNQMQTVAGFTFSSAGGLSATVTAPSGGWAMTLSGTGTGTGVGGWSLGGSMTMVGNSGATHFGISHQTTLTTNNTNQSFTGVRAIQSYVVNNTGATALGFLFSPQSITGTQQFVSVTAFQHDMGYVRWNSVLSPSQITSNQNDYNPTGLTNGGAPYGASIIRLDFDAPRSITSMIVATDGRLTIGTNRSAFRATLTDDDGSTGTAANRFALPANALIEGDDNWLQYYDATTGRIRIVGVYYNFTSTLRGFTPASGGGSTNFLRADGTWAVPPGTTTASNGLTLTSSNIKLGGVLVDATTTISGTTQNYVINLTSTGDYTVNSENAIVNATSQIQLNAVGDLSLYSSDGLGGGANIVLTADQDINLLWGNQLFLSSLSTGGADEMLVVGSTGEVSSQAIPSGFLSGLTTNRLIYATSSTTVGDDSGLTWDATNDALTIGSVRIHSKGGTTNVYVGDAAGNFTMSGALGNAGMGNGALSALTSGDDNNALGRGTLSTVTTGSFNTGVGTLALSDLVSGTGNTAFGYNAGLHATGSSNIFIGFDAGDVASLTGARNIILGYDIDPPSPSGNDQLAIQNIIFGTGNAGTGTTVSTGSIGIGTASPDRRFHVEIDNANTNAVLYDARFTVTSSGTPANGIGAGVEFEVETSSSNNEIGATIEAVTTDVTSTSEDFDLVFKTMTAGAAAAERVRITSDGRVGIGAAPNAAVKLDVQGSDNIALISRVLNTGTGHVQLNLERSGGTASAWAIYAKSATTNLVFYSGGSDLFTFSTAGVGTAVDWIATSDRRLKTNIVPFTDGLSKVLSMSPLVRKYTRLDTKKEEIGFVAQELFEVAPEYVAQGDTWAVNYSKLVVPLYSAVDELNRQVKVLMAEIESLKLKVKE